MTKHVVAVTALLTSMGLGVGAGLLASYSAAPDDGKKKVRSITGVKSGAGGSGADEDRKKGVDTVPPTREPKSAESKQKKGATGASPQSRPVEIKGVRGTEGTTVEQKNTVESVSAVHGSIESIRGIKGIDTVMLQNLEAALRMQERPQESQSRGGAGTAAKLLTMGTEEENDVEEEEEQEEDSRAEHVPSELKGS